MTDDHGRFLNALREQPDDPILPLVFADWLDDHDHADQAEFIRLQCQFASLAPDDDSDEARSLRDRHQKATVAQKDALCLRLGLPDNKWIVGCGFCRGFLDSLSIPVQWLLDGAEILTREAPLLRKLTVGRVNGWGQRLADLPLLRSITELEVEAWIGPADAQAIAASPHLRQLRSLEIWLGNREGGDAETLAAFAGSASRAYPDLNELRIVDVPGCSAETIAEANRLAGRPIARAVIPLPRLYPIAADFHLWIFAGHLPDGTQIFADVPRRGDRTANLFCFTPAGEQTEIRELSLPQECLSGPGDQHGWEHTERVKEYLRREIGFTPGLIRIRGIDDPNRLFRIEPYGSFADDYAGYADDPKVRPDDNVDSPEGYAARAAYWLKRGAYVFWCGNDWFVGPDGTIDST
jgi:uncharacterized protein (TIGR02996 family)